MQHLTGKIDVRIIATATVAVAVIVGIAAIAMLDTTGHSGSGLSSQYSYDVSAYVKVDPNLILYEEARRPISTGLHRARGIFVASNGEIFVVGDSAIRVLDGRGVPLRSMTLPEEPYCLAVADDKVYIGMRDHVEVRDQSGSRLAAWDTLGPRAVLTSITVYEGNVFVADAGNRIVLRCDREGRLVGKIGAKDPQRNVPGFEIPSPNFDLAVGPDGLLRVVNPGRLRVEAYTFEGDLEAWWGQPSVRIQGFCGCCNPVSFAMLDDGSYVTCEKGLVRVKLYDPRGEFVGVVAGPEQLIETGQAKVCETVEQCQKPGFDVAVDAAGKVYVLDTVKNVVRVFVKKELSQEG